MRVFGWAADDQGCGYYRMGLPLRELGRHGHDTQVSISRTGYEKTADVIVGQRVCNPGPASWWRALAALPTSARPLMVYEIDDDLLGIHPSNDLAFPYFQDPGRRADILSAIAVSDLVTVTTPHLANVVRSWVPSGPPVAVVPNAIPESLLEPRTGRRGDVLGWAGSATHRPDFMEAGSQVARFLRRNPDVQWHSIGADYLPGKRRPGQERFTPWTKGVENYYQTVDFTVGLAPLADHSFNLSKSPLKALEYGAMGIPVVASSVGPYSSYVVHGVTGLLVRQSHEWGTYLRRLFDNPGERAKMGELARRQARANTIESQWTVWERTYKEALDAIQ
jgi:glycosyltransferase involved in cell wall biosynthesis